MLSDIWNHSDADFALEAQRHVAILERQGFRDEKPLQDALVYQRGFDEGMKGGLMLGRLCGKCYASICEDISHRDSESHEDISANEHFKRLQVILLEEIHSCHKFSNQDAEKIYFEIERMSQTFSIESRELLKNLIHNKRSICALSTADA